MKLIDRLRRDYDDSNFVFGAEWVDQAEAFQSDVPWEFMQDSYYIFPAGCELQGPLNCTPIWSSRSPETRNLTDAIPATALTGAIPAGIGCLSSMMAIGGGIMSVKTLRAFNEPMHRAVSAAALSGLAISVPGTLGFIVDRCRRLLRRKRRRQRCQPPRLTCSAGPEKS